MNPVAPVGGGPIPEGRNSDRAQLRQAAEAFEAILLQSLLRRMREAQLKEGFFGESAGSSVYEAMFEKHLAEAVSEGSPLGIADILEKRWAGSLQGREEARELMQKAAQVSTPYADIEK